MPQGVTVSVETRVPEDVSLPALPANKLSLLADKLLGAGGPVAQDDQVGLELRPEVRATFVMCDNPRSGSERKVRLGVKAFAAATAADQGQAEGY
jgi:hypothetical protein